MIFYYSGTGNTRWLAERLGEATGERVIDITDVLDEPSATYRLAAEERLGFCFPVHGWRPPFLMRDFVRQLHMENAEGHYVYAFATCGDDVGLAFEYLNRDLQAIGLRAHSVFSLIMPETHLFPLVNMLDKPEVARQKKAAARETLQSLLPYIYNKVEGVRRVNESRWPRINSHVLGAYFLRRWVNDKPFRTDGARCRHCGLCARICQVKNIRQQGDALPQWLHNGRCTTCFSCYHHCPAHAIRFGHRVGRTQYYFEKEE